MLVGLQLNRFNWPGGERAIGRTFARIVSDAEKAGFDSLWVMDHFFQMSKFGPPDEPVLESYAALSFAAAITERMTLGALATDVTHRHPGVLIKMVTSLDVLSNGRAYLGLGAGWYEREARGLGVPFPSLRERFERLEETLLIAQTMWQAGVSSFAGTHYQLAETICEPKPVSRPRPRILVAGKGEQKTLRLVARYADACNLSTPQGLDRVAAKLEVLQAHCEAERRSYDDIEKTSLSPMEVTSDGRGATLTPAAAVEFFGRLAGIGIDHAIVSLPNVAEPETLALFQAEILPAVAVLRPSGRQA